MKPELTAKQIDILKEVMNIGVGKGAQVLNTMVRSHIRLAVPEVDVLSYDSIIGKMRALHEDSLSAVDLGFDGKLAGIAKLVFPKESALELVHGVTGDASGAMDSLKSGTLEEVGNIVLNSVMGMFSNMLDVSLHYSVPSYLEGEVSDVFYSKDFEHEYVILVAKAQFDIESLEIRGEIILIFEVGTFENLLQILDRVAADST